MANRKKTTHAAGSNQNPHVEGAGTQLSEAYTKGVRGLPLPKFIARGTPAYDAWRRGALEYTARNVTHKNLYAGQECRIVMAFQNHDGQMAYALKTASETVAVSKDKTLLIDIAEARYMKLTEIAE